jgi:hypothetical protein
MGGHLFISEDNRLRNIISELMHPDLPKFLFSLASGLAAVIDVMNIATSFMIHQTQSVSSLPLWLAGITGCLMNPYASDDIAIRMPIDVDASLRSAPGYAERKKVVRAI